MIFLSLFLLFLLFITFFLFLFPLQPSSYAYDPFIYLFLPAPELPHADFALAKSTWQRRRGGTEPAKMSTCRAPAAQKGASFLKDTKVLGEQATLFLFFSVFLLCSGAMWWGRQSISNGVKPLLKSWLCCSLTL